MFIYIILTAKKLLLKKWWRKSYILFIFIQMLTFNFDEDAVTPAKSMISSCLFTTTWYSDLSLNHWYLSGVFRYCNFNDPASFIWFFWHEKYASSELINPRNFLQQYFPLFWMLPDVSRENHGPSMACTFCRAYYSYDFFYYKRQYENIFVI